MLRRWPVLLALCGLLAITACRVESEGTTSSANPPTSLASPALKAMANQLVASAEYSTLDVRSTYAEIKDIGDGRGYTAGTIGFTTATGDLLQVVQNYQQRRPGNRLARYIGVLRGRDTASHAGLGGLVQAWAAAASDSKFRQAQDSVRDAVYFNPAVGQAQRDGLHALGQFIYYDAMVMHGPGNDDSSFGGIRRAALSHTRPPAQGGNEVAYLNAFLNVRAGVMKSEAAHEDTSRIDTMQRLFLRQGNLNLRPPLHWSVYGDPYTIASYPRS